jgi:hypothetical protein
MEKELVSSPRRLCRYHPFFSTYDADGNQERFFTRAFRTAYAAHHWITTIFEAAELRKCQFNWKDDTRLTITDPQTNRTLVLHEHNIQDLIEYVPTQEESQWTPPHSDSAQLSRLSRFWQKTLSSPTPTFEREERPRITYEAPNRHKTTKAPPSPNQVTVAQLAQEYNIPSNKARQILRKAGMTKPANGWTYGKDDKMVQTIRNLFGNS